jgi:hypothetical protein
VVPLARVRDPSPRFEEDVRLARDVELAGHLVLREAMALAALLQASGEGADAVLESRVVAAHVRVVLPART